MITRDAWGIPTIEARTATEAWFELGRAAGQDRLWQLEHDRRRAAGRWAEVVGPDGIAGDLLARRLDLVRAAQADVAVMSAGTLDAFTAYAAGVDAAAAESLPPEYAATGTPYEPWQPWHSVAVFKVRHVLMGEWQRKLGEAMLAVGCGPEALLALDAPLRAGQPLTVPAGGVSAYSESLGDEPGWADAVALVQQLLDHLSAWSVPAADDDGGSNVWAVAGSRSRSGRPLLINDSHRDVDVPNAYYQARVRCDAFRVAGATFPGLPGFPHFGHTDTVGWAITHGAADTQDLLIEHVRRDGNALVCRTREGWAAVTSYDETIMVAGAAPVRLVRLLTPTGPVISLGGAPDDPGDGAAEFFALSLRWTATVEPSRQFEVLDRMLRAGSVAELLAAQEDWVDPVNNLVCADTAGHIGYLLRGVLPQRSDPLACRLPVPAWTAAWTGRVPFAEMPRELDPPGGVIVNGNNLTVDPAGPLLVSRGFTETWRALRVAELLGDRTDLTLDDMAKLQADRVSLVARSWASVLAARGPYDDTAAEQARQVLAGFDGDLAGPGAGPLLTACFRTALSWRLVEQALGPAAGQAARLPGLDSRLRRVLGSLVWPTPDGHRDADDLDDVTLREALAAAWARFVALGGPDGRTWADLHQLRSRHLVPGFPGLPHVPVAGDAETVAAAGYLALTDPDASVTLTSVYRQLLDFGDLDAARWVIPAGASALPRSPHRADQLALWARDETIPMHPQD